MVSQPRLLLYLVQVSIILMPWLVILLYFGLRISKTVQRIYFSWFMAKVIAPLVADIVRSEKKSLFSGLSNVLSSDPELRKTNSIRLLEIGMGSGSNLNYYPENCEIIAVDVNENFEKYFRQNAKKYPKLHVKKFVVSPAEDMATIPDNSVDVVVSTHVLCSVENLEKVLKEIHRVLVPNGQYFFLEHTAEKTGTVRRIIQKLLTPFSRVFLAGCHLDRETAKAIEKVGFSNVVSKITHVDLPFVCSLHIIGRASK